jgi:hypothetical protein
MKKLYVVVRKDLNKSQQAVQAGHALAEHVLLNKHGCWDNGTLVYLGARNEDELKSLTKKLEFDRICHTTFCEPDIGNELTAVASLGNNKHFKTMNLL